MKVLSHRQHILRVNELKIGNRVRFMIAEKDIQMCYFLKSLRLKLYLNGRMIEGEFGTRCKKLSLEKMLNMPFT